MAKELIKKKISIKGDDELGMSGIAFTKNPAVMIKGMAFNSQFKKNQYFSDDLKYRICAPAMVPMDIYRNDDDGEYEVVFTAEIIDELFSKFMSDYSTTKVWNLEHNEDQTVPAYIFEAWIVDNPETDKAKTTYGIDTPKGTLMITTQITDKEYYNKLVLNEQVGYSIEGLFGMEFSEVINNNKNKKEEMIKKQNYAIHSKSDGMEVYLDGEIIEGTEVFSAYPSYMMVDGKKSEVRYPVWDDIIELADGKILTLFDSKIVKVEEGVAPTAEVTLEEDVVTSGTTEEVKLEDNMITDTETGGTEEVKLEEDVVTSAQTETQLAEEVITEPVVEPTSDTYTKLEIDTKIEEILKLIADFKAEVTKEEAVEDAVEVKMSAIDKIEKFAQFSRNTQTLRF